MNKKNTATALAREAGLIVVGIIWMIPIFVMINVAVTAQGHQGSPIKPASQATFANFSAAWKQGDLGPALLSSGLVTVLSIFLIVVVSSLAAYPLARVMARWTTAAFYIFMIGLLVPYQLIVLPLYQTMRDLSLLSTPWSLVLFYLGLQAPFSIFIYTQFLRNVPRDFEEAAMLDGCSPIRTFAHIIFPLLRPITATVCILNGIVIWTDFFTPLLYVAGSRFQTAPVALYSFVNSASLENWPVIFSALITITLPALVVFFLMQRTFMKGFATGLK